MTKPSAPECCLRVSLLPLRLNVDQVRGGRAGGRREPRCQAPEPSLCPHFGPQDALLFLKDYFTSLAAGINPMVPAETSAEGERPGPGGLGHGLLLPCPRPQPWAHPWPVSSPAHPEARAPGSSPQEGQPEGVETSDTPEAAGGGQGASSEQQPIYFR